MSQSDMQRATGESPGRRPGAEVRKERAFFGAPVLDDLLPEGITYTTQIMATGETGVGKSVLAAQFLYEGLLVGDVCIYVACDEPPDNMRESMANLRLGTIAYEQAGRLAFLDAFARQSSRERNYIPNPNNLDEFFSHEKRIIEQCSQAGAPIRLVIDSLSTVFGTLDRTEVLKFNRARLRYLGERQVLTLDNYVTGLLDERTMAGLSHAYPLMLRMGYQDGEGRPQRFVQLGKLRSGMFNGERRKFRIDPRAGIVAQR